MIKAFNVSPIDDNTRVADSAYSQRSFLFEQSKVEVEADLLTQDHHDEFLEQMVSRLSLEPGITGVSWRIIEQEFA